jgi:hypothetical protein
MVADTSFSVAREASVGVETVHDYEAAERMAYSGLAQLESLHTLSPENVDGLYLLVRAWTGVGQGFIMDEYERALERDDERAAQIMDESPIVGEDEDTLVGKEMAQNMSAVNDNEGFAAAGHAINQAQLEILGRLVPSLGQIQV